jgi:inosine-uridine nucleoside N-ribohydrolase
LIDCDPGIDDALALLFALSTKRLKVEAITTVYGNVSVEQCTENLIDILSLSGLEILPEVGKGAKKPLAKKRLRPRAVHGTDGLGDTGLEIGRRDIRVKDAVELAASKILSGSIDYIVATGPLTNVANIIAKIPDISDYLKGIYIMGGAIFVRGNITQYAEFNIYNDPEAALLVFRSDIQKTIVSLDVTQKVVLSAGDMARLRRPQNALSDFVYNIAAYSMEYNKKVRRIQGASMHDPLCVGVVVDEGICDYASGRFDIKTSGQQRGRVVKADGSIEAKARVIKYCRDVNVSRFKKLFINHLKQLYQMSA